METAEQFNAWIDGFTSGLSQMTDFGYDFFIYSLMLIYKDRVDKRITDQLEDLQ